MLEIIMKIVLCFILLASPVCLQQTSYDPNISIIAGSTRFALELLQATSEVAGKFMNIAISPISVWSVLALLREGSGGKTQIQLQKALHLFESTKDIRTTFRKVDSILHDQNKGVEMDNAGAIFTDGTRSLKWQFEYLAEKIYQANVLPVNFSNPSATVKHINRWVANVTHNNIEQLVHEDDMKDPHLVIANGLFFKGQWEIPFNVSNTFHEKFYDDKGDELGQVMMMRLKNHFRYSFVSELGAKVVELPYQGGEYSMYVMVPTSNTTLDSLLARLSMKPMKEIYDRLVAEDKEYPGAVVDVLLPRVVIHSDYVLNKALENLGIIDIFNDAKADLSGISVHNLYLHKMIHKAEIVINEEGTIASSATGGVMTDRDMNPVIHANRPFAFFIVEKTMKLILFAGKVVNPHM